MDQAPFKFIDSREGPNGHLQLRYGSGPDDPLPFILTLTPQYVAHATGKTLAITLQDVGAGEEGKDRRDCLGLCVLPPSTPRPIISVVIPMTRATSRSFSSRIEWGCSSLVGVRVMATIAPLAAALTCHGMGGVYGALLNAIIAKWPDEASGP